MNVWLTHKLGLGKVRAWLMVGTARNNEHPSRVPRFSCSVRVHPDTRTNPTADLPQAP